MVANRVPEIPALEMGNTAEDPAQDFGFSVYPCYLTPKGGTNLKMAVLLRSEIESLFLHFKAFIQTVNVFSTVTTLCEPDYPNYTFCDGKRGEIILYEEPIKIGFEHFPRGELLSSLELYNQDSFLIGCANLTIITH
ncbi:lymphocyte antigen 86 isoform X2 [Ambystoma mexicanum]|uniref:lymphocyte antigen 86 isoform X2 n=1 Tax=Ambystoma mexicanum TaxID=8296 RepID=UPI0037E824D0